MTNQAESDILASAAADPETRDTLCGFWSEETGGRTAGFRSGTGQGRKTGTAEAASLGETGDDILLLPAADGRDSEAMRCSRAF